VTKITPLGMQNNKDDLIDYFIWAFGRTFHFIFFKHYNIVTNKTIFYSITSANPLKKLSFYVF